MFRWRVADVTVGAGWSCGWSSGFSNQLEQRERKWVLSFCVGCFNISIVLSCIRASSDVFRGCGGARSAHNMVPLELFRHQALTLVQQLLLTQGGDDDMGTLLGVMHGAASTEVKLKSDILKVWRQHSFVVLLFIHCISFLSVVAASLARKSPNTNSLPKSWWLRLHHIRAPLDGRLPLRFSQTSLEHK